MEVSTSQSPDIQYQCFIDTDYRKLQDFKRMSEEKGLVVKPIISMDSCNSKWMLAVQKVKI